MIFFVNGTIGMGNSGVEHAEFYRGKVLTQAGLPFRYLFYRLNRDLQAPMKRWGLANDQVINMWEYFVLGEDYLKHGVQTFYPQDTKLVIDSTNTHRKRDTYTTSGLHVVDHMVKHPDKHKKTNILLVGSNHVELFNMNTGLKMADFQFYDDQHRKVIIRNIHLYHQAGGEHLFFSNGMQLIRYFFERLNLAYNEKNIYMIDRGIDPEVALFNMHSTTTKVIDVIHADQLNNRKDPRYPLFNNYNEYLLTHMDQVDKVIVATERQRQDMLIDFPGHDDQIVTIPVGGVRDNPTIDLNKRPGDPIKFVTASRLAVEKHVDFIVKAVVKLHDEDGVNLTLDIFGAGEEQKRIKQAIEDGHASDYITLKGQSANLDQEYPKYDAYLSGSYSEGFGLTYIEALNAGLPIVTFNARFGAQELVTDGQNGFLADFNREDADYSVDQLYQALQRLMAADYGQLRANTVKLVQRYQDHVIAEDWRKLVDAL
ncbi:glycosyltransferase Gtf1 [Levilactobacillus zymae]|uniref:Glycosyltransferase Gtf1 n=1 Tax=Levilactobacillus zymae TaxID=267363 RepID=A0ABQ0WVR9_9LACO|nr:glycosyltransferase [Levilactobacillus zymae]KRL07579.1 glycosyltransferase [Levilactobacillus zymae DSM 19395]QFR62049.1 glycosyltransferase [Levilactobacillus zymae]GEO71588.1 glycosyltransferase Gtf1 [Levilactobacillus zymae]